MNLVQYSIPNYGRASKNWKCIKNGSVSKNCRNEIAVSDGAIYKGRHRIGNWSARISFELDKYNIRRIIWVISYDSYDIDHIIWSMLGEIQ